MLGPKKLEIPLRVIQILKEWNACPKKANQDYDKRVAIALLLMCTNADDLTQRNISQEVKQFICGNCLF